jgi:hypothetical protein
MAGAKDYKQWFANRIALQNHWNLKTAVHRPASTKKSDDKRL